MSCNILFTQVQNALVKLLNLKAEIADPEAHVTNSRMYNVKFSVITFNEVFESVRSESRPPLPHQSSKNVPETTQELAWKYLISGDHAPYSSEFPEPPVKI
jgi:hypothetical protein